MSCPRCQARPVYATPTFPVIYPPGSLPPSIDLEVPFTVYQPDGAPSWLPSDFAPPRLCSYCGVIYCPRIEPPKEKS